MFNKLFFAAAIIAFFYLAIPDTFAQKVGFISSETIRDKFPEAKQTDQRINSMVEEWKREIDALEKEISALEFEIQKNRLVWSDDEKIEKEKDLEGKRSKRRDMAKMKFGSGGEYDNTARMLMQPIEDKIYAAIQEVSTEDGYDIIWDLSVQPLAYQNFKYDITVKVLRKLGVDVEQLEKEQKEKIDRDPRNQKKESATPASKRKKSRSGTEEKEFEQVPPPPPGTVPGTVMPAMPQSNPSDNLKQDTSKPKVDFEKPNK
ncbi:MAG: ompH [Ignavibacteria bacterium]|nr:ompH [Ignavibacteria bacterium]